MTGYQYPLPIIEDEIIRHVSNLSYQDKLIQLLSEDLDFHDQDNRYASHNFHSFPAKFPPQLPRKFITGLTNPGDIVLDPMIGSGTTVLEALLAGQKGIGFDIDPLALIIARVKATPLPPVQVIQTGNIILKQAKIALLKKRPDLDQALDHRWDFRTRQFVDYWFTHDTQIELIALINEIEKVPHPGIRDFFKLVFSAIIITKSGGVSSALDLAHTRPHKAKYITTQSGENVNKSVNLDLLDSTKNGSFISKTLRSPITEFEKRFKNNVKGLLLTAPPDIQSKITLGNAQSLPLKDSSVDLIVTSPPYAANAIDYMRAHKFSLVWLGYPIDSLGKTRKTYIGGEIVTNISFEQLPDRVYTVVANITALDKKKGQVVHRYYSEMTRSLREMHRVLKPGKAAIVVVGSSILRGRDTETHLCLANIGQAIGFEVSGIGVRKLDRDRRMMPAGAKLNLTSQIQQRMHEEYVIGFYKPGF